MNFAMRKQLCVLSMIVLFFGGCAKDNSLQQSVFISDPENPQLPIYSEWGYNTFGAFYDRSVFVSNNSAVPSKVIVSKDTLSFELFGQLNGAGNYYSTQNMTIDFQLKGFSLTQYTDLTKLNDSALDLTNPLYQVLISIDGSTVPATILNGSLFFKRTQNLQVDDVPIEVILSGYFNFQAIINNNPVTISNGRFDVGIGPDNFYVY